MGVSNKRLLDAKAAAMFLCISRATLYRLIQKEQIHSLRIGNRRLFDINELDDFVDNLRAERDKISN